MNPRNNAEFVACMEDVLDVYKLPYDKEIPVVCMDEQPRQLIKEKRTPIQVKPGKPKRIDYEYERVGTANLFMFVEPLNGIRYVDVRKQKTKKDWAEEIKILVQKRYPEAKKIIIVLDNLNTHVISSLYECFPAEEARQIARKIELHHTPKHGSWLNIAEIELSAISRQCLNTRIDSMKKLERAAKAWEADKNRCRRKVDWHFTTEDARIKLKRLYPQI